MPTDPIRTTRSGRVSKQTSRSSLTAQPPATTSTSRSRNRDASNNPPQTDPPPSRARQAKQAKKAKHKALIEQIRKEIQPEELESESETDSGSESEGDDTGVILGAALRQLQKGKAGKKKSTHWGRSAKRSHRHRRYSTSSSSSSASPDTGNKKSFRHVDHHQGKTLRSSIQLEHPLVAKVHFKRIYRSNFNTRDLL